MHYCRTFLSHLVKSSRFCSTGSKPDVASAWSLRKKLEGRASKRPDKKAHLENAESTPQVPNVPVEDPNTQKLMSLIKKLEEHSLKDESSRTAPTISDIFSGLKMEDTFIMGFGGRTDSSKAPERRRTSTSGPMYDLLKGPALDIFTEDKTADKLQKTKEISLFEKLEREELESILRPLPRNAFEEAINLTREGKMWNFPINNEQGVGEESNISFHEHVFLERFLTVFPRKGPIRHFMELVTVGLSKNPYLSIKEKQDHIMWFVDYFKIQST